MNPKISVIIAVYNGNSKHYNIKRTIDSVLNQTYKNFEIIVIDGGSTDGTVEIIKNYAKKGKIDYWVSEKDKGIYDAMNKGIIASKGDIVYFVGSDDLLYKSNVFKKMVDFFNGNVDIISGGVKINDSDSKYDLFVDLDLEKIKQVRYFNHQGIFVSKKMFDKNGLFNTKYSSAADFDFIIKCLLNGAVVRKTNSIFCEFLCGGISSTNISLNEIDNILINYFGYYDWFVNFGLKQFLKKVSIKLRFYWIWKKIKKNQ